MELSNVVVRGAPLTITVELGTYPVPVSPIIVLGLPAVNALGVSDVMLGTEFLMLSGKLLEPPPFGCGLITATCRVPAVDTSEAGMPAISVVGFTKPVDRLLPFTVTIDCETKFIPVTVSVNEALPVVTPDGESEVICGTGLGPGLIVNCSISVVPPPGEGVETETVAVPAFWTSLA